MKSPNEDVREQSLWCLGNIVADNNEPSLNVELKFFITPFFKSP